MSQSNKKLIDHRHQIEKSLQSIEVFIEMLESGLNPQSDPEFLKSIRSRVELLRKHCIELLELKVKKPGEKHES